MAPDRTVRRGKLATDLAGNSHGIQTAVRRREGALYEELATQAQRLGYDVSPHLVRQWQSAGLLPSIAVRTSLGRARGFKTELRAEALERVVALCRLRGQTKSWGQLAVLSWLDGWDVDPEAVRRHVQNGIPRVRKPERIPGLADRLASIAMQHGPRLARRLGIGRIGSVAAADGAFIALEMAFGLKPKFDSESASALESAIGVRSRARKSALPNVQPWLTGETVGDLDRLSRAFSLRSLWQLIDAATPAELQRVRRHARLLAIDFPDMAHAAELSFGRNFAGWRLLGGLRGRPDAAVALALLFNRLGLNQAMDDFCAVVDEGRDDMRTLIALGDYYVAYHPEQRREIKARGITPLAERGLIEPLSEAEQTAAMAGLAA